MPNPDNQVTQRKPRRSLPVALVALTALTAAACNGADGTDATPSTPPERPTASPAPRPEPSSVSAADGHDIDACTDGDCEIAVSKPVTIRFEGPHGPATLSVTEVGSNRIEYEVTSGNGQSKGGASGPDQGCLTILRKNGSGNSCGDLTTTRPSARPGAVVIQATTGADGTALLHIVSP
ncbi:hypothetical protein [Streptomyces sp. NPDC048392]|uniref:hypothetical protein n=1 Tax=Streptomyces sp. NPDC048392 TaxID=3365543 RepID=UPI003724116A